MNTPENQPPQLSSEEATLERELKRLRPASVPLSLREQALEPLESADLSPEDHALAKNLTSLRPMAPSGGLWDSIADQLDENTSDKVITVPQWRDFTPIFKVAAMVAIGLFAAAALLRTDPQPDVSVSNEKERPNGQLVPISRSGTIQNSTRVRFMEKDKRIYEQRRETLKDSSRYKLGPDIHVDYEVTRERNVYSPRRTF